MTKVVLTKPDTVATDDSYLMASWLLRVSFSLSFFSPSRYFLHQNNIHLRLHECSPTDARPMEYEKMNTKCNNPSRNWGQTLNRVKQISSNIILLLLRLEKESLVLNIRLPFILLRSKTIR